MAELVVLLSKALAHGATLDVDFQYYLAYTAQWLHGGHFYADRQLVGPYALLP